MANTGQTTMISLKRKNALVVDHHWAGVMDGID